MKYVRSNRPQSLCAAACWWRTTSGPDLLPKIGLHVVPREPKHSLDIFPHHYLFMADYNVTSVACRNEKSIWHQFKRTVMQVNSFLMIRLQPARPHRKRH